MRDRIVYLVWRNYQRRAETLADALGADVVFLPNRFRARRLRPLDYAWKFAKSLQLLRRLSPTLVVVQSPPVFVALPAHLLGVQYVIDAHNATFQGFWGRLPLSRRLLRNARAVMVHNEEIAALARSGNPSVEFVVVRDPLPTLRSPPEGRHEHRILVIASFAADEPVDDMIGAMERSPHLEFVITANPTVLSVDRRTRLLGLENVVLTGFVPTSEYNRLLTTSRAALVLTTRAATQPSGACEALASDTPLVVSDTALIRELFGSWARLTPNDAGAIADALRDLPPVRSLAAERERWKAEVRESLMTLDLGSDPDGAQAVDGARR